MFTIESVSNLYHNTINTLINVLMKLENEYKEYVTRSSWQYRNGFYAVFSTKTSLTLNEKGVQNVKTKTWLLCVHPLNTNTNMLALMSLHWSNNYLFSLSFSLSFLFLPSFSSPLSLQELFPLGSLQTWTQWIQQLWQVLQFPFKKLWWYNLLLHNYYVRISVW